MEDKQRRMSRVLTIDEIINPPGLRASPVPSVGGSKSIAIQDTVNPNFLRINHGQVMYTPGLSMENERGVGGGGPAGRKNVPFASVSSGTAPSVRVYREQYWNWSCACKSWTKRERTLLMVVGILGCIILGLVCFISVYSRNHRFGSSLSDSWLGWTL